MSIPNDRSSEFYDRLRQLCAEYGSDDDEGMRENPSAHFFPRLTRAFVDVADACGFDLQAFLPYALQEFAPRFRWAPGFGFVVVDSDGKPKLSSDPLLYGSAYEGVYEHVARWAARSGAALDDFRHVRLTPEQASDRRRYDGALDQAAARGGRVIVGDDQ